MSTIFKVREHDPLSSGVIYHQSSADIIDFDSSDCENLDVDNTQDAVSVINAKVEECATKDELKDVNDNADSRATTETFIATIKHDGFEGSIAPFTQTIDVEGIKETDNPIVGIVESDSYLAALDQRDSWGTINRITCGDGFITVFCYEERPTTNIDIQIKVIR